MYVSMNYKKKKRLSHYGDIDVNKQNTHKFPSNIYSIIIVVFHLNKCHQIIKTNNNTK